LEHDPQKRGAAFRNDHARSKSQSATAIEPEFIALAGIIVDAA
jgi:hypothetical protein